MWTRQLLKKNGKEAFMRNYWTCVLVSALASLFITGSAGIDLGYRAGSQSVDTETYDAEYIYNLVQQIPDSIILLIMMITLLACVVGICFSVFVGNIIEVGHNRYYIENREHKTGVERLFYSFHDGRYLHTMWTMFLKNLYIFGWTLLFWIPGIIKSYAYMMVPYILAENPHIHRRRALELSESMMNGHKMEAFELSLSFIGWNILGAFTGGIINVFFAFPYQHATFAEFYSALKAEALQKGILQHGELPGVSGTQV